MSKLNSEVRIYIDNNEIQSTVSFASSMQCRKRTIIGAEIGNEIMYEINDAVDTLKSVTSFTDRWDSVPYTICDVFIYGDITVTSEMMDEIADKLRTVRLIHEVTFHFRKKRGGRNE